MADARHVAVIDIGKTNVKVVLFDLTACAEVAVHTMPNHVIRTEPYPHADTEAAWSFMLQALGSLHAEHGFRAISITTHGATAALLDAAGDLALPVLDYEFAGPDSLADAYADVCPPFAETGSPRLPGGLNIGRQIFWQHKTYPEAFSRVETILTYAQYWTFRLTGMRVNEVTSLGCHSDLWAPWANDYSTLVERMGWRSKMAPIRRADEIIGPVRREIAAAAGLPADMPVYCGLHDSNASLLPHLWAGKPPFAVVSTGTWVVAMAVGGTPVPLDAARDTLVNVSALGRPVPSSRFMGGRAFQLLVPDPDAEITAGDRGRVLQDRLSFLPSRPEGSGPYPRRHGGWTCDERALTPGERLLAVSYHLALMSLTCLNLIGADGDIVVEGPFAANPDYLDMLAAASGRGVRVSAGTTGTSLGAAGLVLADKQRALPQTRSWQLADGSLLAAYAENWMATVTAGQQ